MCVDQGIAYIPSEQSNTWTGLDILICQKKKKKKKLITLHHDYLEGKKKTLK